MGLVHEAYASPTVFAAQAGAPVPKEPPQAIEELPPEQKPEGDNVQWINGYFAYDDQKGDFYWVSGIWRIPPDGYRWVPGYWSQVEGGYVRISGFWAPATSEEINYLPPPPQSLEAGPNVP